MFRKKNTGKSTLFCRKHEKSKSSNEIAFFIANISLCVTHTAYFFSFCTLYQKRKHVFSGNRPLMN